MVDSVGQSLGRYRILEKIGAGGMATVYRGIQTSIGREVAIKVLSSSLAAQDEDFLVRFQREVQVSSTLQHPHILPVYDFGDYQGSPYIVMAYLKGGTLADLIRQGPMVLTEATRIITQLADALDFAHKSGVIHRDFKPSNVMLDERGNVYLADFGLAKVTDASLQLTGSRLVGTPDYMAPDLVKENGVTRSVDVYAMGVTLYQMLSGHVPFKASTPMGVLMAHMSAPIPDIRTERPDLGEAVQQVINLSMAKSADERFPTAGDLACELHGAMRTPQGSAHPLLFTDKDGEVIFTNSFMLKLLGRSEVEARSTVGRPLGEVLGLDNEEAEALMRDVCKVGHAYRQSLALKTKSGASVSLSCSGTGTFDDKGECVGADFTFLQLPSNIRSIDTVSGGEQSFDTGERTLLQMYATSQLDGLRALVIRLGGLRLGETLERILNETSARNQWPFRMKDGRPEFTNPRPEPYIYHGLLAKAVAYAVSVIGSGVVRKQMKAVDDQMGERSLKIADRLGLLELVVNRYGR
jgi:serine/threonine protein kinase